MAATGSAQGRAGKNYGAIGDDTNRAGSKELDELKTTQIENLHSSNDAKAKTQVAATTSMAVIHIGILKVLLDVGHDGISYYDWCLGVVIAALVLQFMCGVIAIYIAMMKSFLTQFHGDFAYYCKSSFCPCLKDARKDLPMAMAVTVKKQTMVLDDTEQLIENPEPNEEGSEQGCSPCCRKSPEARRRREEPSTFEEMLLDEYSCWMKRHYQDQKRAVQVSRDITLKQSHLAKLQDDHQLLMSKASSSEEQPAIAEHQQELNQNERDLEYLMQEKLTLESTQKEGEILRNQLRSLTDDKVLKKAAFWQCLLTVLTYMVFALNAVITGFGLANIGNK